MKKSPGRKERRQRAREAARQDGKSRARNERLLRQFGKTLIQDEKEAKAK